MYVTCDKKLCENYVELETGAARTRLFPVIETSVTWGENRAAGISRPEACTGREGHSFLCLLYSAAQVGSYVTKITSVYLYMFHSISNVYFPSVG